jgi:hypothetical protein
LVFVGMIVPLKMRAEAPIIYFKKAE